MFESYQDTSLISFRFFLKCVLWAYELDIPQAELDSVEHILRQCRLVLALINDLYSFHKEFEEHSNANTLGSIQNAMAVLMVGYGYNETEAEGILRQEISDAEQSIIDDYKAWMATPTQRSQALESCITNSILATGGNIYWMSHTERYHRHTFKTTVEDRAKLIPDNLDSLPSLSNHAPPVAAQQTRFHGGHFTERDDVPAIESGMVQNGVIIDPEDCLLNGTRKGFSESIFLNPFKKAPAREVR